MIHMFIFGSVFLFFIRWLIVLMIRSVYVHSGHCRANAGVESLMQIMIKIQECLSSGSETRI